MKGENCVILAAKSGNLAAMHILLSVYHLYPSPVDSAGLSPLHIAVLANNCDLVSMLIENGANTNVQAKIPEFSYC